MRTCKVDECNKKHFALGYCQSHYYRFKKYGDPHTKLKDEKQARFEAAMEEMERLFGDPQEYISEEQA